MSGRPPRQTQALYPGITQPTHRGYSCGAYIDVSATKINFQLEKNLGKNIYQTFHPQNRLWVKKFFYIFFVLEIQSIFFNISISIGAKGFKVCIVI
jgi:hypothetical protein